MSWSCSMLLVSEAVFKAFLCVPFQTVTLDSRAGDFGFDPWGPDARAGPRYCLCLQTARPSRGLDDHVK